MSCRPLQLILPLALALSCGGRALQGGADQGVPGSTVDLGHHPHADLGRPIPDGRVVSICVNGKVTVTTDRKIYTLAEAGSAQVTICNGLGKTVYLWLCNTAVPLHLEAGRWKEQITWACKREALELELQPDMPLELGASLAIPGLWQIRVDHGVLPGAGAITPALSEIIQVQAERGDSDCTAEWPCPLNPGTTPVNCYAPGEGPCGGPPPLNTCNGDAECKGLGDPFICGRMGSCGPLVCIEGCQLDTDCPLESVCAKDHRCSPKPCPTFSDCPVNFTCGKEGTCARASCKTSAECLGYCVSGLCYDTPGQCLPCCPP
jgi:hypothetical protein